MKTTNYTIITREELAALFEEQERTRSDYMDYQETVEGEDGRLYTVYEDMRTGEKVAAWYPRTVHFGLNAIPAHKVQELIEIVEREGGARASWSCDGRTRHQMLANRLAKLLPQYHFDIGYNYKCEVSKK